MNNNRINQLIGFFMGEGAVKIGLQHSHSGISSTHIALAIGLRGDDLDILYSLRDVVGGIVYQYDCPTPTGKISTQARWCLSKSEDVYKFLLLCREYCDLPFKKMKDVEIGIQWCAWRMSNPHHGFDQSTGLRLREELMSLHRFNYR